jgi:ribosomal protein L29
LSKNERRCESLLNRKQKEEIVKELHEKLLGVKCAVLTDFRGLDVSAMNTLRNELRAASVEYRVACGLGQLKFGYRKKQIPRAE